MSDKMTSLTFKSLIVRMLNEYKLSRSIFSINEANFFTPSSKKSYDIFGEKCLLPLGPAAGPHTQLSQNIVSSYLTGSRFLELKTVQLNVPHVLKPCIDAIDEGHNVEWSSEYEVEDAYREYMHAWVAIHFLEELLGFKVSDSEKSFIFNMSVGYDLEGIKNKRVDNYIESLKDSSENKEFKNALLFLDSFVEGSEIKEILKNTPLEKNIDRLKNISKRIGVNICKSLTLSTMHGCPPDEIEKIASYMIAEKKLNTYVKLNPTLLGYDKVRNILDTTGFNYVLLKKESFEHDLQYSDGLLMLKRLKKLAADNSKYFGVKLTNTLGNINDKYLLPGDERYMSGRSLYPISISVAEIISKDFNGDMPISYSGGLNIYNVKDIFSAGIRPLTLATELLKPGGYNRLNQIAKEMESMELHNTNKIDVDKVSKLAKVALTADYTQKSFRGYDRAKVEGKLPVIDCAVAPCVTSCPIHQPIPEYIKLVGENNFNEALKIITEGNILPAITGSICDHQCQKKCTRMDYEGAVKIRCIKLIAVQNGVSVKYNTKENNNTKVMVIGAGPAGLSAAAVLRRYGFDVTVRECEASAGGVVKNIIPQFRISEEVLKSDIKAVEALGVEFKFGEGKNFSIDAIKKEGYKYIVIAIGAYKAKELKLKGDNKNIIAALDFLREFNKNKDNIKVGESVAVIGAGNTAMDTARAAKKLKGIKEVVLIYRRTEFEMPADEEEIMLAKEDGIKFYTLSNPYEFKNDKTLVCKKMVLGDKDKSGRRSPVQTEETFEIKVDTVITSLGYQVDEKELINAGINIKDGEVVCNEASLETTTEKVFVVGDGRTGPSSIVSAIADGTLAAKSIIEKENIKFNVYDYTKKANDNTVEKNNEKRKIVYKKEDSDDFKFIAKRESERCLECNKVCNKCVDVCPNRANVPIKVEGFNNYFEIIHIDDYCNECGNCGFFCPWDGEPYKDKLTVFSSKENFLDSKNIGFYLSGENIVVRFRNEIKEYKTENFLKVGQYSDKEEESFNKLIAEVARNSNYLAENI